MRVRFVCDGFDEDALDVECDLEVLQVPTDERPNVLGAHRRPV